MATFVLIHGAFRGGWSMRPTARALAARGHDALTPSLTGAGERVAELSPAITLERYADDVAQLLHYSDLREVILVGHSQGGVVILAAAERCAERVARLVFLDAPVPDHGERAVDQTDRDVAALPSADTIVPPQAVEPSAHVTPAQAAWISARLVGQPVRPALAPLVLTDAAAAALPRSYIFCEHTPAHFPAGFARRRLDSRGVAYRVLEVGHDAPSTHPEQVADALEAVAFTAGSC